MKWFNKLLTVIALVNIVIAPLAQAAESKRDVKPEEMREVLESMGYRWELDEKANKAVVYEKDSNKVVMEIPLASEGQLRKYSPKSMNKMMLEEITRVRTASKDSWSHSVRALPTESAIFFMAMGAVVAGQLIMNYSQNPVAMKQHMDHSMSPMGVFGFFAFMYSQGVTSNVLSMYMKNPKFHHMIPYLGMTVGAFIQTYLSSFASDPNVKACAASWVQTPDASKKTMEQNPEACEKAFEYFLINKKIWEFAPGIVSMLVSSGIAGVGQSMLTKGVLRVTGVDIAMWLTPGTMQLKGMRLLLVKGLQITAFVAIDALITRKISYVWKNMFDGNEFYAQNDRLNELMNEMKSSNWKKDEKALIKEVKHLRERLSDWRMMNMSEVYEAHQNWQEALGQMTSMFNTSYAVYGDTIAEIRNTRFNESNIQPLVSMMPLAGVRAKGLAQGKEDIYLLEPQFAVGMQLDTAKDAAAKINEALAAGDQNIFLYPAEQTALKKASALLASGDEQKVLAGILELQKLKDSVESNITSQDAIQVVYSVWNILGSPVMPKGPGQGYYATYEKAPSTAENVQGTNYYRVTGAFQTPKITDYLVMQMLCGPDVEAGGKVVRNSKGYPSVFAPPQIAAPAQDLFACSAVGANLPSDQIYSRPVETANKKYNGVVSYLVGTARPSIVGDASTENFDDWWNKNTQKQITDAFAVYSVQYEAIVAKLVKNIFAEGRSVFNGRTPLSNPWNDFKAIFSSKQAKRNMDGGPIMNGGMQASLQEERIYLALLEELMKPAKEFDLEFGSSLERIPSLPVLKAVDQEFKNLESMIRRIKVTTVNGREVVSSDLENYELEEQTKKIQSALSEVSKALGVGDESDVKSAEAATSQVPKARRELAVQTLQQLEALATEIMMYGTMANAVTWEKIRDLKRINMEQDKFNNEIQAKMNQLRGVLGARH